MDERKNKQTRVILRQVLDYLAIGVHELASISERRTERLVNPGMVFT